MKRLFLPISIAISIIFLSVKGNTHNQNDDFSLSNEKFAKYMQLSGQQLFDTAKYYYDRHIFDTALIFYNLFVKTAPFIKDTDVEQQKNAIITYHDIALIHCYLCDYRSGYDYFLKALLLSEKYNLDFYVSKIYNNLGTLYLRFNAPEMAKSYYLNALLNINKDTTLFGIILNNLGTVENIIGNNDSAFYYFDKSLQISTNNNRNTLSEVYSTIGVAYNNIKLYDSAYHYFRLALEDIVNTKNYDTKIKIYSSLVRYFVETNKPDSALHYIDIISSIENIDNYPDYLTINYFNLIKIEELKGNYKGAFEYYKIYDHLKDSIFGAGVLGDINQLQRLYEVSKTNQQIEQLIFEQKIKERTIHYKNIIWYITLAILLLVSVALVVIYSQKRKLNKVYKVLFDKNVEIIDLYEKVPDTSPCPQESETEPPKTNEPPKIIETNETNETNEELSTTIETTKTIETTQTNKTNETSNLKPETSNLKQTIETIIKPLKTIQTNEAFQKELQSKILIIMENTSVICKVDFSLDELADLANTNHAYVSWVLNNVINKSFRTLLNSYRIREAQKILKTLDTKKYTIESVINQVGYKSKTTFINAFKEVTGVSPQYYLKSLQTK